MRGRKRLRKKLAKKCPPPWRLPEGIRARLFGPENIRYVKIDTPLPTGSHFSGLVYDDIEGEG